ncbi:uncharacterized protein LOC111000808 [Pieris rapae]|uniref:uncharacterized protein LOC111000808 n=1 Tax=Pieris rapae TaxID=64459 RepID=UPI001E27EA4D|nr:uncharacterized protein LOC111000808 [Pieris rapae]
MIAGFALVSVILGLSGASSWAGNPYAHLLRNAEPPSIAYGFGGGFSSNIGGISHSSGYGTSFQTGNAQAYGAGIGSNGNAHGVGFAQTAPNFNQYQFPPAYSGFGRTNSAVAHSSGNFGSAVSSVQNGGLGSAVSAVHSNGRYQSAISSVQNFDRGLSNLARIQPGFISRADNVGGVQTAISSTQGSNGQATSIAQNFGRYKAAIANNVQLRNGVIQNNGATVINGPGFQSAQAHAINTGY